MSERQAPRPVEFIDNYFPVIDGVTETVHEYARHMNAPVVCPAMESRYLEKHDFPYPVLTSLTLRVPFSRYASALPALDRKLAGRIAREEPDRFVVLNTQGRSIDETAAEVWDIVSHRFPVACP